MSLVFGPRDSAELYIVKVVFKVWGFRIIEEVLGKG